MAPRKVPTKATCNSCGKDMFKKPMEKHISTCPKRLAAIASANAKADASSERLFHLQIESISRWKTPIMWFDIEMRGDATLGDLDEYIRGIWLDIGGRSSFTEINQSFGSGVTNNDTIEEVFKKSYTELRHSYDNGCNQCLVTCEGVREGIPLTQNPIVLLARNTLPIVHCNSCFCESPSTRICVKCWYPPGGEGYFCQHHIFNHFCGIDEDDEEYLVKPFVNSPRSGIGHYRGPAEPPY